ncbi:C-type lectin domain family 5 member A isoform X2 [Phyllostomus discolor]|uniref:C-type lectin domain family 5 member A n=1 Tax=Phyllostomus discolor TaxID=89673 RepID=A0A7E6CIU1_9CHIR|nr:C-type lectin domain family 5 member A isoform X2 [Phyllostomus discolor]
MHPGGKTSCPQTLMVACALTPTGLLSSSVMNWHMIISVLIVVALKVIGTTLFLLYFPQIFGNGDVSFSPTESSGTVCPRRWDFLQGRCFFLFTSEMPWGESRAICEAQESTLAIVNTPEKLKFLQDITGAEKYFIGLRYQPAEKRWRWIDNSVFNGNVTNELPSFNCVTMGLTKTFDAALCDTPHRWICDKPAK